MLYEAPVKEVIAGRLGMTVVVTFGSILLSWILALPIGIYSAVKQYSIGDYFFTFVGFIGLAVPDFLLSLLVLYFAFALFDAHVGGLFSSVEMYLAPWSWAKIVDLLKHLWLPAIILGLSGTADLVRIMRSNLLDELGKPYVVTARAKGLKEFKVITRYAVRVALNPFVSTIGYILPRVVSGGVIVAIILGLPTVGPLLYSALIAQDMFLAGTIILLISTLTVIGTLMSDILLVWVDPRIRLERR
jgi:peptide/nickel transport system permease protein